MYSHTCNAVYSEVSVVISDKWFYFQHFCQLYSLYIDLVCFHIKKVDMCDRPQHL